MTESIRLVDVHAYWRRLRAPARRLVDGDEQPRTREPVPCAHCDFCEFAGVCESGGGREDSLHFVAGIRSTEIDALEAAGVDTLAGAGATGRARSPDSAPTRSTASPAGGAPAATRQPGAPPPWRTARRRADAAQRDRLPAPDDGDVFLDFEGHPFWTPADGLFFLFGLLTRDGDGLALRGTVGALTAEEAPTVADARSTGSASGGRPTRRCTCTTTTTPSGRRSSD